MNSKKTESWAQENAVKSVCVELYRHVKSGRNGCLGLEFSMVAEGIHGSSSGMGRPLILAS